MAGFLVARPVDASKPAAYPGMAGLIHTPAGMVYKGVFSVVGFCVCI